MTIREVIKLLESVDEGKKDLPLYVFDYTRANNYEILGVSLFDGADEHTEENMLSININNEF